MSTRNRWSSLLRMIRAIPILFLQLIAVIRILGCGASESQPESGANEKMKSQFTFSRGITVSTPNDIHEGYSVTHRPEGYSFLWPDYDLEHDRGVERKRIALRGATRGLTTNLAYPLRRLAAFRFSAVALIVPPRLKSPLATFAETSSPPPPPASGRCTAFFGTLNLFHGR